LKRRKKTIIQLVLNFNRVVVAAAAAASPMCASCGLHPIKIHTRPEDKKQKNESREENSRSKTLQRFSFF
jgi:ribosomal protein L12E/L44/L45/RPP1/RPP2